MLHVASSQDGCLMLSGQLRARGVEHCCKWPQASWISQLLVERVFVGSKRGQREG